MFAGKKSAQIREILISESAWEEMTCLFAPSLDKNNSATTIPIMKSKTIGLAKNETFLNKESSFKYTFWASNDNDPEFDNCRDTNITIMIIEQNKVL
ncbi:hypothetical protein [uncultured Enterobacter sp.]|uniref:hypothetical protein n=1 Tax=uncultured Enterobacter sp. TaxID=238202 RepID=UPI0028062607|nr:hypothetical protein [uncultured Enterobacter sp.]